MGRLAVGVDVADDPRAVTPERALVFELIGPVGEFEAAARELGFEWLASQRMDGVSTASDDGEEEDDDVAADRTATTTGPAADRLYLTMPSVDALDTLLARWRSFLKGEQCPTAWKPWWSLFGYLHDVRTFSVQDRIDPSIKQYVKVLLNSDPDRPIVIEIDLWYRDDKQLRDKAVATLRELLAEVGGEMLDFVTISEIRYQAALVRVPAEIAKSLVEQRGKLAHADGVMTIRPQSFFQTTGPATTSSPTLPDLIATEAADDQSIAAIIDGYPITSHAALDGRIVVHEVDLTGAQVPVNARYHGTAMASLVVHDDLHEPQHPPEQKVVVVPVLTGAGNGHRTIESTPPGKLPIGMIYRAIQSLVVGQNGGVPAFPRVVLINHSICDEYAPFVRRPTPWAALLDYFSHKHNLLFVVSAGNIKSAFPLPSYDDTDDDIEALNPVAREAQIILAIEKAKGTRGILSPAESINSITAGALHADLAGDCPDGVIDPYPTVAMTNLGSALGPGINRSIKPDVLHHGGRLAARFSKTGDVAVHGESSQHLGQLVAAPDAASGDLRHVSRLAGTSNAAALVTRSGIRIAQAIEPVFRASGEDWHSLPTRAAILKALLTHSCEWGGVGQFLAGVYPPEEPKRHFARRETVSRFLGYGNIRPERVLTGHDKLVTLLGDDVIEPEDLHEYRVPVPSGMLDNRDLRRITITLAWSTPVLVTTADYRGVALGLVDESGKAKFWKGVQREKNQPNRQSTERGTTIHHVFEGKSLVKLATDPKGIFIGVQCRAVHPTCETAKIPYALAVSMEVAQSAKANIYAEVSQVVNVRSRVRTRT